MDQEKDGNGKGKELTTVDWSKTLQLKDDDYETGDFNFEGCLEYIKRTYEHLLTSKGIVMSESARVSLKRGLVKFEIYEPTVLIIREQKAYAEIIDADSIYANWFRKDPDFELIGKRGERLHFETEKRDARIVRALATVLGVKWQLFIQILLSTGLLGSRIIPLVFYRGVEKNVANFVKWIEEKKIMGAEYVYQIDKHISVFKTVEKRLSFDDIYKGKKLTDTTEGDLKE
ncbi:hypothetical protein ES702_07196 [subsurface metagenome]